MAYIKQLDSLRAIAIFFVLCNHWFNEGRMAHKISNIVSAPDIFFTISGFLITALLLKDRLKAEASGTGKGIIFKNFYIKRVLRIFPAYYLAIFITWLIDHNSVPDYRSYLTFTANFEMHKNQHFGNMAHLWSMSVEQQFYLCWPLLILFIPKKILPYSIMLFIVTGVISQHANGDKNFLYVLPQTCLDALGLGALLAWVVVLKNKFLPRFYKILTFLCILSVMLIILHVYNEQSLYLNHRTLIAIIITWLIAYFIMHSNDEKNYFMVAFNTKPLLLVGKISYGIYLYHLVLFINGYKVLDPLNSLLGNSVLKTNQYFLILENIVILFGFAWVSWKFFELPISNFKKYLKPKKLSVAANENLLLQ